MSVPLSKLVMSDIPTMLNTSAGAGRLEATPKVGDYVYGSAQPCRGSRPGASAGRRLRCAAATSAARRPVGRAAWPTGELAAARTSVFGGGMHQVPRERLVARSGAWRDQRCGGPARPSQLRRRSPGQAMMHPMQSAAPGCIAIPAGAMMMHAAQRNQLHHRCIRSRRTVKSQVAAAMRRPGRRRAPQHRTLRRRQRVFTQTAE